MKPFYLLILSLLSLSASLSGQKLPPAVQWKKTYGGTKADKAASVIATSDHGFLVVGYSYSNDGQVTGHHGSTTTSDAWVVKLDEEGNLEWQHSYGGTANDNFRHVIETGDGDFICVGTTASTDGDVTGLHTTPTTQYEDVWAMRISNTGSIIWSKVYGGTAKDHGQVIRLAIDGG